MVGQHEILLTIPALPEFLRVVRVTASGLSSRLGFSLDDVDDLRLALDEMCFAAIGKGSAQASLSLRYEVADNQLTINGTTESTAEQPSADNGRTGFAQFSEQILAALVDEHRAWSDDAGRHFSLTKRCTEARA